MNLTELTAFSGPAGALLCRESSRKLLPLQIRPGFSSSKSAAVLIDLLMVVYNGCKAAAKSGFYYWPIKHSLRDQVQVYYISMCYCSDWTGK